ncbi:MAG: peptidyl-prolyl cis-trans isomerase [Candidatus Eisenbacteria bacterium]
MKMRGVVLGFVLGLLCSAVFLVGLQCSGGGGPGSSGSDGGDLQDLVLGRVGKQAFTVRDLNNKIRYQYPQMMNLKGKDAVGQYRDVLRSAIDELCWITLGQKKGYQNDPEFKATWELSRRYILAARTIEHEVRAKSVPSEEEIQNYYQEHRSDYMVPTRVQAAHVLVRTLPEAKAVRARLLRGESIADLARTVSIDEPTKANGGVLGWMTAGSGVGHLGEIPQVNAEAMKLQRGETSEPVEIPGMGWTVLQAIDRTEATPRPFDDAVRQAIARRVQTTKHNQLFSQTLAKLQEEYGAKVDEEAFQRYSESLLSEEDLFGAARDEKDPDLKIRLYEGFAAKYPASERAAQAEFMVGFLQADEKKDYAAAREAFERFLQDHPDHELAASARWMLDNMEQPNPDPARIGSVRRQAEDRTGNPN